MAARFVFFREAQKLNSICKNKQAHGIKKQIKNHYNISISYIKFKVKYIFTILATAKKAKNLRFQFL